MKRRMHRRKAIKLMGATATAAVLAKVGLAHADTPPAEAIIVDDQDAGFQREGPPNLWWTDDDPTHYNGRMTYTYNTDSPPSTPTNWAIWETPPLPADGIYTVVVYIPLENAQTHGAVYKITDANGDMLVQIDQAANKGKWVELGLHLLYHVGDIGQVYLDDVVPETDFKSTKIAFDAMVWLLPGVIWNPGPNLVPYDPLWAQLGWRAWQERGGDPVSTALGNYTTRHQDLFVPGPGLSVDFTRSYNSRDPHKGVFGLGWTCTYSMSAIDRGNGEVIVTMADGRAGLYIPVGGSSSSRPNHFLGARTRRNDGFIPSDVDRVAHAEAMSGGKMRADDPAELYTLASSVNYTRPNGFLAELTKSGDEFILSGVDQLTYTFNATNGKLKRIADLNSNQLTFEYTESNYVLTDAVGRQFKVKTKDDKFVEEITDPIGRVYKYEYDGDKLIKFTNAETGTIQYTYNGDGLLETITDPNGHAFVTNHYDSEKRVDWQKDANSNTTTFTYQDNPRITTIVDNESNQTLHEYDDRFRLVKETDALGRSMIYDYDADDNRTYIKDREEHETFFTYDSRGNLKKIVDALDQETLFDYNAQNKMTFRRDASGAETLYEYDALGINLKHIHDAGDGDTWMEYYGNGLLKSALNPENQLTQFTYDTYGSLETVQDALGNTTRFKHDMVGRREEMTDANPHTVKFTYDNNDRVKVITDPKTRTTLFEYDAVGNLKSVTDRRSNTTRYEYNVDDTLREVIDPRDNLASFTYDKMYHRRTFKNRRGNTTEYFYDEFYDLRRVKDAKEFETKFEYDMDHNLTKVADALNGETKYKYDPLHRLEKMTDALSGETVYTYDPVGRVKTRLDPNAGLTQYEYDKLGRLLKVIDAENNPTEFTYDKVGNRQTLKNARGNVTHYNYNDINQLIEQIDPMSHSTHWKYDAVGNVLELTDRRGNVTKFLYDENDNLEQVADALDGVVTFTYDEEDNRRTVTDQNNHTKEFTYDELANLETVKLTLGQTTTFEYDENSNRTAVINAKNNKTQFEYDRLDLLTRRISPLTFATQYEYDALRRLIRVIDAENNATRYGYDALSRLTEVEDALHNLTQYQYDPVGNLRFHIDANSHTTEFVVDKLGRVKQEINPLDNSWHYKYDEVGNRIERTDANGPLTDYKYDADDRLERITYPNGAQVIFAYDENDNLIGVKDSSGEGTFAYDELNRLKEAKRTANILAGKALGYEYDPAGNRTKVIYPDGKAVNYRYTPNDWLDAVTDPMNGLTQYARDDVGLPTRILYPNGTGAEYAYDADDRLAHLFNGKPQSSADLISSYDYTLDKVGNRKRIVEKITRGQVVTWTKDYEYDAIYRLRRATETPDRKPYQVLTSEFEYDAVGNRKKMATNIAEKPNTPALRAPVTTNYDYNDANELLKAVSSLETILYAYDKNGNRTAMNGKDRAIDYAYDFENRLSRAATYDVLKSKRNLDAELDFTYDGLGRRMERGLKERGVRKTEGFLYDALGYDLLVEYLDPAHPITTFYYRDPLQVLSRHEIQGAGVGLQYFHHYDGLGSVCAWTNQAGREVQGYRYAPYGRLMDNNNTDNASNRIDPHNPLTFSGKPWDKETELNHFGARDYDSKAGVWLTQDPYRGRLMEPMTLHRYGYVGDSPINWIDPYGLDAISNYLKENNVKIDIRGLRLFDDSLYITGGSRVLSASYQSYTMRNGLYIAGTQHTPLLKSLSGGTFLGYVDLLGNLVVGPRPSDLGANLIASQIRRYSGILKRPFILRDWALAKAVVPEIGEIEKNVRKPLEILRVTNFQVGSSNMDPSSVGNIVFGYYMAALGKSQHEEDIISDVDQNYNLTCIKRRFTGERIAGECVPDKDNEGDIIERRIGRELYRLGSDPNKVDDSKVVEAVNNVMARRNQILAEYHSYGDLKKDVEQQLRDANPYLYYLSKDPITGGIRY